MASGLIVAAYDYAAGKLLIEDGINGTVASFDNKEHYLANLIQLISKRAMWIEPSSVAVGISGRDLETAQGDGSDRPNLAKMSS